jgi:hypothetical protein
MVDNDLLRPSVIRAELHKFLTDVKIDSLIRPTPVVYNKNINIEYPGFLHWLKFTDEIRHHGDLREKVDRYALKRWGYIRSTTEKLDKYQTFSTSQAVMDQIGRASHSVSITPDDWDAVDAGETTPVRDPLGADSAAKGVPVLTPAGANTGVTGTGKGDDARIKMTPDNIVSLRLRRQVPQYRPFFALFHELVHAMFIVDGKEHFVMVNGGFTNSMEFYAVVISDILMSESGETALLASHEPPFLKMKDTDDLLNRKQHPTPRVLFAMLQSLEPKVFWDLAHLPPGRPRFNPIRQFNDEQRP